MKLLKFFLSLVLIILLLLVGSWLYLNYAPQKSTEKKTAAASLTATELYTTFETDEAAANQRYIGQILQVKGRLGEKLIDENLAPVLVLREANAMAGVMCTLFKNQQTAFDALAIGDSVTMKGKCNGMLMDVVLDEGVIE
ncbi:MAG: hypothetical protein R2824_28240 [Saprospiraceae bacterium]|nr:hypothetical protein [Lewinella sp.]